MRDAEPVSGGTGMKNGPALTDVNVKMPVPTTGGGFGAPLKDGLDA